MHSYWNEIPAVFIKKVHWEITFFFSNFLIFFSKFLKFIEDIWKSVPIKVDTRIQI